MHPVVLATKYKATERILFLTANLLELPGSKFIICMLTLQLPGKILAGMQGR